MNAPAVLRRAADTVEACAIGERKDRIITLLALHIIRACGAGDDADEAKLLCSLLEDETSSRD